VLPSNGASIALVRKVDAILQNPASEAERILIKTYPSDISGREQTL
jgi:hypothetical protein